MPPSKNGASGLRSGETSRGASTSVRSGNTSAAPSGEMPGQQGLSEREPLQSVNWKSVQSSGTPRPVRDPQATIISPTANDEKARRSQRGMATQGSSRLAESQHPIDRRLRAGDELGAHLQAR